MRSAEYQQRRFSRRLFLEMVGSAGLVACGVQRIESKPTPTPKLEFLDLIASPDIYREKQIELTNIYLKVGKITTVTRIQPYLDPYTHQQIIHYLNDRHIDISCFGNKDDLSPSIRLVEIDQAPFFPMGAIITFAGSSLVDLAEKNLTKYSIRGSWILDNSEAPKDPKSYHLFLNSATKSTTD